MGAIRPELKKRRDNTDFLQGGSRHARRDNTDFTEYAEGGPIGLYANINGALLPVARSQDGTKYLVSTSPTTCYGYFN